MAIRRSPGGRAAAMTRQSILNVRSRSGTRTSPVRLAPILAWVAGGLTLVVLAAFFVQAGRFHSLVPAEEPAGKAPPPQQITAARSTISGLDRESQPYRIDAASAVQDADRPHVVHLQTVGGELKKGTGEILALSANAGLYDTKAKTLDLSGDVRVDSKNRFTANLEQATVVVEEKRMNSASPVVVTFDGGTIRANGVEITDDGNRILFTGGVRTSFRANASKEDHQK